jgi:hypothetical protein
MKTMIHKTRIEKRVLALVVAYENNSLLFVYYVYYTLLPYNIKDRNYVKYRINEFIS